MIVEHSGTAIDISELISINREEVASDDNRVVFKFRPTAQYVKNPETGELELHAVYPTAHSSFVMYEAMCSAYDWWVEAWTDYKNSLDTEVED